MSLRKSLIKLANRIESAWHKVDFSSAEIILEKGWYVTEFIIQGAQQHTPRILVQGSDADDDPFERTLSGFHSGRNRMLIYLPQGRMLAHSKSIEFTQLARVPTWEGRARILLICFRYLLDFFSARVVFRMIAMQFKNPLELSSELLVFYAPLVEEHYLDGVEFWQRNHRYAKYLAWFYRRTRIAILLENDSQREALEGLLIPADVILVVGQDSDIPNDIDYLVLLAETEQLREPAILMLKQAVRRAKVKPNLIYTDHDYIFDQAAGDRVMAPVFKPEPSAVYLHCFAYLGPALVFSRSAIGPRELASLFSEDTQYQLELGAFKNLQSVVHLDEALFVSTRQSLLTTPQPTTENSFWPDICWQRNYSYNVLVADEKWRSKPSVDLIIPTRDGLQVLQPCIDSLLEITDYPNFSIIVVDNGSELPETKEFLAKMDQHPQVAVIDYPGEFNYSAINNFAIAHGSSDYVAMINNDIEIIHADWLTQMMVWAKQPSVGIVGAKLLFGSGLVQHAGVVIGMGNAAGHIHRLEEGDSPGYQNRCVATQNMMAVTAACLITPRKLFESLGGLDEQHLKVAYNDIDYCLRVEQMGLDVIWTPQARLYHHESVSRGDDMSDKHIERYFYELSVLQKRWKTKGFVDKCYSRHLRVGDEGVYPQVTVPGEDVLHYVGD